VSVMNALCIHQSADTVNELYLQGSILAILSRQQIFRHHPTV